MKTIITMTLLCLSVISAEAQKIKEADVPSLVREVFNKKFPKAEEVKWSKENLNEFEAEFEFENVELSATFTPSGEWTGTETEIKKSVLSRAIQEAISKEFAGYKIKEVEKVETPEKPLVYEVELQKGDVAFEVQFANDGTLIKKEKIEEKKEK